MVRSYDWGDPELAAASSKMSDWYKCNLGFVDVIRIITKCDAIWRHQWNDPATGRWRASMCSKEEHGSCPFCDQLANMKDHKRRLVYATTVLHITHQAREGQPRIIGRLLAWRFGDEKKDELMEIHETTGKRLLKVDLRILVKGGKQENEQFQNLSINPLRKGVLESLSAAAKKTIKAAMSKERLEEIYSLYHPTPDSLMQWIKQDEEAARFDPSEFSSDSEEETPPWGTDEEESEEEETEEESEEEESPPLPKKKGKGKKKSKKAAIFEEEDDDDNPLKGLID